MNELEQVLTGDSAHTPPAIILEGLPSEAAHGTVAGAPHTIYEELWHIAFWQQSRWTGFAASKPPIRSTLQMVFRLAVDAAGRLGSAAAAVFRNQQGGGRGGARREPPRY
jgi:hypothetical protein